MERDFAIVQQIERPENAPCFLAPATTMRRRKSLRASAGASRPRARAGLQRTSRSKRFSKSIGLHKGHVGGLAEQLFLTAYSSG
jgi:hypothetical protein